MQTRLTDNPPWKCTAPNKAHPVAAGRSAPDGRLRVHPDGLDRRRRACKNFAVRPEKSSIYVYRNERLGFAAPMSVSINGRLAGKTLASTFWVWEVDPGEYSIAAPAEDITAETLRT